MSDYDQNKVLERDRDSAFDDLLGVKEPSESLEKQAEAQGKEFNPEVSIKELQKQMADKDEMIRQQSEKLKALEPMQQTVQKMQSVFVNDEESVKTAAAREALTRQWDEDPAGTFEQLMEQRENRILQEIEKKDRKRSAREVISEVEKEYDVDLDKDGKKIAEALERFSPEYKERNLKQAVISAIELTKTGKRRKTLPHVEGSSLSPEAQAKQKLSREQEFKKLLLKHKEEDQPLRGLFSAASMGGK